ncbi:hypothetical protein [Streptomyces sp. Da 82-17]|uniref:hypothetical protein n=1 Tax=Streptomyces sp. Da 82-17 TaxID=3377116 RepID=UPI0038D449D1
MRIRTPGDRVQHFQIHTRTPSPTAMTAAGLDHASDSPLKLINRPVRDRIPIVLAATGPKNVATNLARRYGYEAEAAKIRDLYLAGHKEGAAAAVPADLERLKGMTVQRRPIANCLQPPYVRGLLSPPSTPRRKAEPTS